MKTAHGEIHTPAFVPVGTKASVKALTPEQVRELGVEVILGNTYHLYLQPGDEIVKEHFKLNKENKVALFGIVQGGRDEELRKKSAKFMAELELARTDGSRGGFV